MADAEIVVGIRGQTEGGKTVKRTLDDISSSGKKAQQGTKELENQMKSLDSVGRSLSNVLKGVVAAFGLRELQQTADAYTNVQNRLKLVTGNASELLGVTKELFAISNETRNSFTATAEVYARTALATKDLGLSQRDTLAFTRSLNQAVILSGASAAESTNALIQLSQGLASGALRGDELRSVLEQLPAVADVIAQSLGVTRGELRKMGEDGTITAEVIIEAFQKASGELDTKFGLTVSTMSQAFTVLKNNITEYIGELDAATGASTAIAGVLLSLGQNIDSVTKFLIIGTAAWVGYQVAAMSALGAGVLAAVAGNVIAFGQLALAVGSLTGFVELLNAAFLTGPLALVAALAAAGAAAFVFRDELKASLTVVISEAIILIDQLSRSITSLFGLLGEGKSISGLSEDDLRGGATDVLIGLKNKQDGDSGTISSVTGKNVTKPPVSKEMTEAMKEAKRAAQELKGVIAETSTEQETLIRKIKELEKLRSFAKTAEEVQAIDRALNRANKELETASTTLPGVDDGMDRLIRQTDRFADSAADAFGDFVTGAKSAKEALSDLLGSMAKLFLQEGVTAPLSDALRGVIRGSGSSGGGLFGSLFSGISGAFSGGGIFSGIGSLFGFAGGGSMILGGNGGVDNNTLSLNGAPIANVGRGEVLSISPNQKGGNASVVVNQTINVSTGVVETVRAEMVAMLPEFQSRTVAAVNEANQRGY